MKQIIEIIMALALVCAMSSCAGGSTGESQREETSVSTTGTPAAVDTLEEEVETVIDHDPEDGLVAPAAEDEQMAQYVTNFYRAYIVPGSDEERLIRKNATPHLLKVLRKMYDYDGDGIAVWAFRDGDQDPDPYTFVGCEPEGDGWFRCKLKNGSKPFTTRVKVVGENGNYKIDDVK